MSDAQNTEFKSRLSSAQSVLLLLPPEPDQDSTSAVLSLYHSLSGDKQVLLGCSTDLKQKYPDLSGVEVVKSHIGNQTLVVSFDYQEDAVENVSYDIDDATKKFNLRISPRPNQPPLDVDKVTYSYTGAQADLVITFAISSLEELGTLYSEEKTFLDTAVIANLVASPRPSTFAAINLNFSAPLSESVANLIKEMGLKLSPQAATALLQQLVKSTNNFTSSNVDAETFELAAFLLRNGAQKTSPAPFAPPGFSAPLRPPFMPPSSAPYRAPFAPAEPDVPDLASAMIPPKIYRGGSPLK